MLCCHVTFMYVSSYSGPKNNGVMSVENIRDSGCPDLVDSHATKKRTRPWQKRKHKRNMCFYTSDTTLAHCGRIINCSSGIFILWYILRKTFVCKFFLEMLMQGKEVTILHNKTKIDSKKKNRIGCGWKRLIGVEAFFCNKAYHCCISQIKLKIDCFSFFFKISICLPCLEYFFCKKSLFYFVFY